MSKAEEYGYAKYSNLLHSFVLGDNTNLNGNDVCENLAIYNPQIEEVHIAEKRRVRTKGLKALARCPKLRILELEGGPFQCDPEDSLEQLAVGCPLLERYLFFIMNYLLRTNILVVVKYSIIDK